MQSCAKAAITPIPSFTPLRSSGLLQRKCACSGTPGPTGECESCREKRLSAEHDVRNQREATPALPPIVQDVLSESGQPLDAKTRAFMEPRFGHDFGHVRVHNDEKAADSARAVHAHAYTVGKDVVFGENRYAPTTHSGRELLAHELAHTVQQRNPSGAPPSLDPSEIFESSAAAAGRSIVNGGALARDLPVCGFGLAREPDPDEDDDDVPVVKPWTHEQVTLGPTVTMDPRCPSGVPMYNGVCMTTEVIDAMGSAEGDVKRAEKIVREEKIEQGAQKRIEERYEKVSYLDLNKKIEKIRDEIKTSANPGSAVKSLERLEKEQARRRALPIAPPTKVDQAIVMLEEAWSLAEKEQPRDVGRAAMLVDRADRFLQTAGDFMKYSKYFSGIDRDIAVQTAGQAKGQVASLNAKLRFHSSIGGHWELTINAVKVAREILQIMNGEKDYKDTKFSGEMRAMRQGAKITPLAIGGAALAPGLLVAGGEAVAAIPALPATIQGVRTAVWGKTLLAAGLSSSYLSHVVARSKEAAATEGGSNPISIVSAALLDTSGAGQVIEAAKNQSLLTGEELHHGKAERVAGAITGTADFVLNFFGAKDLLGDPIPQVKAPRPVATAAGATASENPNLTFPRGTDVTNRGAFQAPDVVTPSRPVAGLARDIGPKPAPVVVPPGGSVSTQMPPARVVQGNQPTYGAVKPAFETPGQGPATTPNPRKVGFRPPPKDVAEKPGLIEVETGPREYVKKEHFGDVGPGGEQLSRYHVNVQLDAKGMMDADFVLRGGGKRSGSLTGKDEFLAAKQHFEQQNGAGSVKGAYGRWGGGDNLDTFNTRYKVATDKGFSHDEAMIEAARKTKTGEWARAAGFTRVNITKAEGQPGAFTNVEVEFTTEVQPAGSPSAAPTGIGQSTGSPYTPSQSGGPGSTPAAQMPPARVISSSSGSTGGMGAPGTMGIRRDQPSVATSGKGSRSGEPPPSTGRVAPLPQIVESSGVPEEIPAEQSSQITQRLPNALAAGGEMIGEFRVVGTRTVQGDTVVRNIGGLYHPPTTDIRPLRQFIQALITDARAQPGATRLVITGEYIANKNVFRLNREVARVGGTIRKVDEATNEIIIPLR
jgi:hypothetical protein